MDNKTANALLQKIRNLKEKQAFWPSSTPVADKLQKARVDREAMADIAKYLLMGLGTGASLRGAQGLYNLIKPKKIKTSPYRTADLPIPTPESEKEAYSKISNPAYLPAMLLGTPLAAYGGWKAVDRVLDEQRSLRSDSELERAKREYEEALKGSFRLNKDKQAGDVGGDLLKSAYYYYKKAASISDIMDAAKGGALTYSLLSAPLGFMLVNSAMRKGSKAKLIEKALEERARRQATKQPIEFYAKPAEGLED